MVAARSSAFLHPPRPRHRTGRGTVSVPIARPAPWPVSPPVGPTPSPNRNQAAADSPLRTAVLAAGVVIPVAVLAMCFCLPRRESARPTPPAAVEPPPVAVVPAVVPVAARPSPEPTVPQELPAAHPVTLVRREEPPSAPEVKPPAIVPAAAQVEKPLAALALPPRDEPKLPVIPPPQPEKVAAGEGCPKVPGGDYGTAVRFARDPTEAGKRALEDNKLLVVFTISGNFEDSKFT